MKPIIITALVTLILFIGIMWQPNQQKVETPGVVSQNGIHWHTQLHIYQNDKELEIPQNIGLGAVHLPIHTHEDLPSIHLEFGGIVREKDIALGQFFKNWGTDMRSFGANMKMIVNGKENNEYENYIMHDNDIIELRYE